MDIYSEKFLEGFQETIKESAGKLPLVLGGLGAGLGAASMGMHYADRKSDVRRGRMVDAAMAEAYRRQSVNRSYDMRNERSLANAAISNRVDIEKLKQVLSQALANRQ